MTDFNSSTDNPDILDLQPRLQDADAGVRRIALIELADLEEPDGLPWLAHALNHDDAASVRAEAARLLEAWEEPEVVDALCRALADSDEDVREAAAQSLSELKTAEAGVRLLPWANHADIFVRRSALRALRELRLEDAAEPALSALEDSDAGVRREAVGILGWLKRTDALPHLARLTRD
ncbi:HEAT repeat domain-containing protein, partial [Pseudomonas sp. Pseusp97]|uniref:HEAT repeat domain-containing protein n=1 Tax=Pseudomonas sp. Pseusp97 TaxID=3243065 RepID=UPI0039A59E0E